MPRALALLILGACAALGASAEPVASTCYVVSSRDAKGLAPAFTAQAPSGPRWTFAIYADEPTCRIEAARAAAVCETSDPAVIVYKAPGKRAKTYRITTIGRHEVRADAKSLTCTYLD